MGRNVTLGTVPKGFTMSTPMQGTSIPGGAYLNVTNGCYFAGATVPTGPLTPGVVTTDDQQVSLDEFYRYGGAFTPCQLAETPSWVAAGGLVLLIAGGSALIASPRRRAH